MFQNYWIRFAKLQRKLVSLSEVTDLLKSQLEAIGDILEPASSEIIKYNKNIAATLGNVVKSNYDMLKTVNKKLEELYAQVNSKYKVDSKCSVRSSEAQYYSHIG